MSASTQRVIVDSNTRAPDSRGLATPADTVAEGRRRTIARSMLIGMWIWPSFVIVDAWMCFVAYAGAPFSTFLVIRVAVELLLVVVYRASRKPGQSLRVLTLGQNVAYSAAAVGIALMAMWLGGTRSPYMHGISLAALVRASVIPEPWQRAWPGFTAIALAFPVVMSVGALASPGARAEWFSTAALVVFASNYIFVLSSAVIGLVTSHNVWQAQQQVYRARRVGRYRLLAPIGKGGMGEVWLAWDLSLQRNVALKLLRVVDAAGPEMVARFEREALAASRLHSPHVIQIFDYGASEDGLYYIAMEYLNGVDLQSLVEHQGALAPARAIGFAIQACLALDVAHRHGVIHRDIKPHNLFVTSLEDGTEQVKLLDFGIVRLSEPGGNLTQTGIMVGTPTYLAPELWWGEAADELSDLYALGVTLFFLLAGRLPFESTGQSPVVSREPAPLFPGESRAAYHDLEALVRRCLAREAAHRIQSAVELHDCLLERLKDFEADSAIPTAAVEMFRRGRS